MSVWDRKKPACEAAQGIPKEFPGKEPTLTLLSRIY